jgi:hypothetical protein
VNWRNPARMNRDAAAASPPSMGDCHVHGETSEGLF